MVWIFPKVVALLFLAIFAVLYLKERRERSTPVLLVLAYAVVAILSGVFSGESLQYVLLGGEGRMDGLLYALSLSVFFIFTYTLTREFRKELPGLFVLALTFAALAESLIVFAQRLGHDYVGALTVGMRYPLITGTAGNPGMVAAMLLPAVLIAAGVAITKTRSRPGFVFWLLAAMVTAASLSLVNNRSSFYALLIALAAMVVIYRRNPRVYLTTLLVGLTLFAAPQIFPNQTRVQERSLTSTKTLSTRLMIWKIAAEVSLHTKGQPLWGGGFDALKKGLISQGRAREYMELYRLEAGWPDSVKISELRWLHEPGEPLKTSAILVYARDEKTGQSYDGVRKVVLDKAHNYFLDRTVSTGLLSALIWLVLFLWPVVHGLKSNDALIKTFAIAIAALFIYYQLWFPVPQTEPLHVAMLAIAWGALYEKSRYDIRNATS